MWARSSLNAERVSQTAPKIFNNKSIFFILVTFILILFIQLQELSNQNSTMIKICPISYLQLCPSCNFFVTVSVLILNGWRAHVITMFSASFRGCWFFLKIHKSNSVMHFLRVWTGSQFQFRVTYTTDNFMTLLSLTQTHRTVELSATAQKWINLLKLVSFPLDTRLAFLAMSHSSLLLLGTWWVEEGHSLNFYLPHILTSWPASIYGLLLSELGRLALWEV